MADVELRISADTGAATKEISGFRKEYVELVKAVEKPMRQIDALQKAQESAKGASSAYFEARRRVDELKRAVDQAGQPVRELDRAYAQAQRTLASTTREFERQKTKVREQRAELKAAGVDVRNLAAEQQRLQQQLGATVGAGRADSAITGAVDRFGITQLRNLRAQLLALDGDYRRLTQTAGLSARERITAEIQYRAQVNQTRAAIRELETGSEQVGGSIQAMATKLAAVVAAAYSIERGATAFFDIADGVVTMEDRMRGALATQEEYDRSLARLEETSKRVRIPLTQTSELFLGSVRPLREMGFSAAMTADMVAALSAGLVTSNVKGQQAEAVINQLSQGLQTGTIRGDAFNAMLRNAPTLIDALTRGLGVSRAELIRMANAGDLTTERFVSALSKQADGLLEMADNMRSTVGDARNTKTDAINKVVGAIDTLTGASDAAIKRLDELSGALDKAADGDGGALADFFSNRLKFTGLFTGFSLWIDGFKAWSDSGEEAADTVIAAEEAAASRSRELEEESLAAKRAYAAEFNQISADLAVKFKNALDDQVAAQRKASSALSKARNEQLATEKRYREALDKLSVGAAGPASYNNAQSLQVAARQALSTGDIEGAKRNAQAALDMLLKLAEAGDNTYGFEGMIRSIQAIEQEADKINVDRAEQSFEAAREKTREWKKELEDLKNFTITPSISDEALAKEADKLRKWAQMIGLDVSIAPRLEPVDAPSSALGAGINAPQSSAIIDPQAGSGAGVVAPVAVPVKPEWVQDGSSFSEPVEVNATPRWVRDGNSFGDAVPVEVRVVGIRQDGENNFTNLPPVDVELGVDPASASAAMQEVDGIAQALRQKLQVPISIGPVASGPQEAAGFSAGGWTGPGGKYQPAGVVHADEHVQPKEVVNEPGALSFLERIRRNGFRNTISELRAQLAAGRRGYAAGGLVSASRTLPSIPPLAPALQQRLSGPVFPELGRVVLEGAGGAEVPVFVAPQDAPGLKLLRIKFGATHRR
ncbi:MAG: tape measure protein [Gammaproteobacteria bacterium]|uniref:Putative tail protein n=1 Tax=viral metagenome TaxID=1070528 RepID=A0A6M3J8K3_9ZZZZ|nr:tape measure protein [Gammaproteobacteria bacterium]MBU1492221.1 tape measure protein [Gammaproteobacteria bacterium]MBU2066792.1 tape measure protein [Gammaproteobacteria bacterium]MBU2137392.1 tape measure protein [Gammaproteobacteria bacterium]MBU2215047.1 tape measure protein [Gammaproteobacteria bacterium]